MIEPQYYWQVVKFHGSPLVDIPEEEFDRRLEELVHYLEAREEVEVTLCDAFSKP